mmetsp:Transcript_23274/g.41179  ORF Transcript_23274/g.41179 Transcript_23274/m.41179 type:complete len:254 (-) Transcript_23274:372-1133(-)
MSVDGALPSSHEWLSTWSAENRMSGLRLRQAKINVFASHDMLNHLMPSNLRASSRTGSFSSLLRLNIAGSKGKHPLRRMKSITPRAHVSTLLLYALRCICSGAMYLGDPTNVFGECFLPPYWNARPKSHILTGCKPGPGTSRFSGLRSLWITPILCMYESPEATSLTTVAAVFSENDPASTTCWKSSPPPTSSMTMKRLLRSSKKSLNCTMFGWLSFFNTSTSVRSCFSTLCFRSWASLLFLTILHAKAPLVG